MVRRVLLPSAILLALALQLLTLSPAAAVGATFRSPNYGFSLTFDDSWTVVDDALEPGDEDFLLLQNDLSFVALGPTEEFGDGVTACVPGMAEIITDDPAISDVAPLVGRGGEPVAGREGEAAFGAYDYIYSFEDGGTAAISLFLMCGPLTADALLVISLQAEASAFNAALPQLTDLLEGLTLPEAEPQVVVVEEEEERAAEPEQDPERTSVSSQSRQAAEPETSGDSELAEFVDLLTADIDAVWSAHFEAIGERYESPEVVLFDRPVRTACVDAVPGEIGPFYCPLDQTIYLDGVFLEVLVEDFGQSVVANALSHEWGHHIQQQLGIDKTSVAVSLNGSSSLETELQADCFAGAWTQSAETRGVLSADDTETAILVLTLIGDSTEAAAVGNTFFDTQHGSGTLRTWWFLQGYFYGYDICVA